MTGVIDVLHKMRELLGTPGGWCKRYYALDKNKTCVRATSPDACQFCLEGSIWAASTRLNENVPSTSDIFVKTKAFLQFLLPDMSLIYFNDLPERTLEDVLRFLDEAILQAETRL